MSKNFVFLNKLEPFMYLYPFFGLRSFRVVGDNFTTIHWSTKVLLVVYSGLLSWGSILYIPGIFLKLFSSGNPIFYLGWVIVYCTGTINLVFYWLSNITTKIFLNILNNFAKIESVLPNLNGFVHKRSYVFIFVHLLQISFILYNIGNPIKPIPQVFSNIWIFTFVIVSDFTMFQFCNIINTISSYGNLLNMCLCNIFNEPELFKKKNDPLMNLLKNNVLRYTSIEVTKSNELIISTLRVDSIMETYNRLLDTMELTNSRFNSMVGIIAHYYHKKLYIFFNNLQNIF